MLPGLTLLENLMIDLANVLQGEHYSPWLGYWDDCDGNDISYFLDMMTTCTQIVLDCRNSHNPTPNLTAQQMMEIGICIGCQMSVVVLVSNYDVVLEDCVLGNPGESWYGVTVVDSESELHNKLTHGYLNYRDKQRREAGEF